ncbi:MAG: hypothetical protein L3J09_07330 [Flavobacteriaceae bacterium]|nr:hypothetical protein [Flavobacteriaceae bacterium]
MKYYFSLFILFTFYIKGISQEEIITIDSISEINQSFNVVDTKTGNIVFFLEESNLAKGFLYNKNFELIGKIFSEDLRNKYKSFLGFQINGSIISLFMNTKNNRSYGVLTFNFGNNTSDVKEINFKLKGEEYIESVSTNNSFYLISRPKNKNQFNIYTFNEDYSVNKNEIIFKENDFLDRRERPVKLYDFIRNTVNINNNVPNSIEATSELVKLYVDNNTISITSDVYNEFTFLIDINLTNFSYSVDKFVHPKYETSMIGVKSNSYVYENNLFQIITSSKKMNIQITNLSSKKIIKEYSASKNSPIDFKNSQIILEGGDFKKLRELSKTSQFLRKIAQYRVGISVYKNEGIYQVSLGGITEGSNGMGYVFIGAAVGGIVGGMVVAASINSITYSYYGYAKTKSVRITGLFNKDFTHIGGGISDNPFEIMKSFFEVNKNLKAKTVLSYNDYYLFGFYNKKINLYKVYKI